ncbi:DUF2964 family protein [Burkholderia pseudomallei]|uniref:DUF2964 domain-containing protein n=6 Tax=pseudomallei group TaxID=111527 RepID=Q3JFS9_BURP1|nr:MULTISPECIES: DUF2964 family protein [pseudomallei group]KGW46022.1 hypothetical protein Y049_5342 [Burkholderia pseudomallei MSHR684]AAY59230.1 hypothetical protein BMAA0699 [Burkholderia mallei ATCC 23344]ABA51506.1 hypothetical protein BURPS1710b_A2424 [Burkholderia pseudomallei 1710b]ABM99457.1 hypothetical protein BMA10229_0765 [Burkholderia mallei NCTC 10229]ABN86891.1 hypothetical protein BURPS668_A1223 [Burkholderia pseudomallei 668]
MVRKYRVVLATIAVFISLAGMMEAVRGLLFDSNAEFLYGVIALSIGVAAFVVLLNPTANDER